MASIMARAKRCDGARCCCMKQVGLESNEPGLSAVQCGASLWGAPRTPPMVPTNGTHCRHCGQSAWQLQPRAVAHALCSCWAGDNLRLQAIAAVPIVATAPAQPHTLHVCCMPTGAWSVSSGSRWAHPRPPGRSWWNADAAAGGPKLCCWGALSRASHKQQCAPA